MTGIEPLAYLAARIFTSGSWIAAGIHHAMYFEKTVAGIAGHGIPLPRLVLPIVLLMECGGAALLLSDHYTWAVCLVWIAFLFPATYAYHRQWRAPDGGLDSAGWLIRPLV